MLTNNRWKIVAIIAVAVAITHTYFEGAPQRQAAVEKELRIQALSKLPVTAQQHIAAREAALKALAAM